MLTAPNEDFVYNAASNKIEVKGEFVAGGLQVRCAILTKLALLSSTLAILSVTSAGQQISSIQVPYRRSRRCRFRTLW